MPPPIPVLAELPEKMSLVSVSVPAFWMPPPFAPSITAPLAMVSPEMLTVPEVMLNTWYRLLPEMVSRLAPGPLMVRFFAMVGSVLPSVMVPVAVMVIVCPEMAWVMQYRSVPRVLVSAVEVTDPQPTAWALAAQNRPASTTRTRKRRMRRLRRGRAASNAFAIAANEL